MCVQIDQPKLGLPSRDYFLKGREEKAFVAYEKFMQGLALSLGANKTTVQQDVDEVLQFEVDLANVSRF
jgi:membrane metallo-endopeptidase-like protein 1